MNADNSQCNPTYDVYQYLDNLADEFGDSFDPQDFLLIDCPGCGHVTFYQGGGQIKDTCECCGWQGLREHDANAYSIIEYWDGEFWSGVGYNLVDNFNLPRE